MRKTFITTSIIAAALAMPAFADPTAQELLDQKTVTSKYYVDTTKQDKITTDKVLAVDNGGNDDVYVPAIVTTNAAGTELNGDSIGVLSLETIDTVGLNLQDFYEREDLVPTVAALTPTFNDVYDQIDNVSYAVETKQDKMTCAGYVPGHENDRNYCWLYGEVQVACKAAGVECTNTNECCSELSCIMGKGETTKKCG